ncbi:hypothetical protein GCM10009096_05050 [Parasphingorhabdus litoris]|uniref:Uncharacterized protein n=1 Tax=Parasphingorhabdus litoris TaxID=394733 RepID=A0ABN1A4G5_9SPHN|nr:hypothetical protein [Parasphingorhabdus litoris]
MSNEPRTTFCTAKSQYIQTPIRKEYAIIIDKIQRIMSKLTTVSCFFHRVMLAILANAAVIKAVTVSIAELPVTLGY